MIRFSRPRVNRTNGNWNVCGARISGSGRSGLSDIKSAGLVREATPEFIDSPA